MTAGVNTYPGSSADEQDHQNDDKTFQCAVMLKFLSLPLIGQTGFRLGAAGRSEHSGVYVEQKAPYILCFSAPAATGMVIFFLGKICNLAQQVFRLLKRLFFFYRI